ncbi:putative tim10/DDP zinc finger domain-containing protein [Neospora caninum Liverpool]|uniref:Mitochondrial import inner membrane translocase subunit n=1 Tax=Neospora caninum (strain Liverpool) TaxID=572307 RepID=F0VIC8_NEOCL|nr:putative tim10/DDP zinc finger domain-containing protein [Neospora caninum Liverpool]CBZ53489.1 putative tim10/DDP zinc finger domain-containing protein [Neospora caninum Liverpool]CEL67477.1 TPA: tim10/DDP zinc finger domain-containing protein,putative [Neospora caninum Liverpool]|eukprot:XP_003883521.1 putative tim10/DDP zinc finger domain-containing protein [Neospora caninum Liverpool]
MSGGQNLQHLSPAEQAAVMKELNHLHIKDTMDTYNSVVERCFNECITQFRAKDLDDTEQQCVRRCVRKFMLFSQRVGLRFAEKNMDAGSK